MRQLLLIILVMLISAPGFASEKDEHALPYDALIRSAKIELGLRNKDLDRAEGLLRDAIDNYDNPVEAHYWIALIYAERSNYKMMMEHFAKFEQICAQAEESADKKMKKRCKKDNMPKQIKKNREAAWESNFNSGVKHLKLADSLSNEVKTATDDATKAKYEKISKQLLDEAETEFGDCILIDSSDYRAWTNLGLVESRKENPKKAAELYLVSYKYNPDDIGLLFDLSATMFTLEKYGEAARYYGEIAEKDANNAVSALTNQAICYQRTQEHEKLKGVFDKILELDPNNAQIRYQRGVHFVQQANSRKLIDSLAIIDSLLEKSPKDKSLLASKDELLEFRISFYAKAMPDFKMAAESEQTNADNWYWYGNAAFLSDDLESAAKAYEKAVEIDPGNSEYWCQLALIYAKQKNRVEYDKAQAKCDSLGSGN